MALSKDEVANLRAKAATGGPMDLRDIAISHEELREISTELITMLRTINSDEVDQFKSRLDEIMKALDIRPAA